ncbi:MAG: hypothetical protein ACKV2T_04070 [Kofleriaceae bacterium]
MSKRRMMMIALALAGCTKVPGTGSVDDTGGRQGVVAPAPAPATAKVTLMSVTFGDDCGGTPPGEAPASMAPPNRRAPSAPAQDIARPSDEAPGAYRYRCNQTSMQLSIAAANRDANVEIKSVEVIDESGKSLGTLVASKPTRWSDTSSAYEAWDQKVATKQTALVSYVLTQPSFINRWDSHDRMYTVKVTAAVGGVAQSLQTTVMVVAQPAPVPT